MRFLVTAGPTREPIDDVRYVSNRSTGVMGCEIAAAAARRGHAVTMICGPVSRASPEGVAMVSVETALDMHEAVMSRLGSFDALVMAAAVADFRPRERIPGKRKKSGGESETWSLVMVRNPDILAEAGRSKGGRVHAGFALESDDLIANARKKLAEKNLDLIVANAPSAIGASESTVTLIMADGSTETMIRRPKSEIAIRIVTECERLFGIRGGLNP